jgi:hypothetical protein
VLSRLKTRISAYWNEFTQNRWFFAILRNTGGFAYFPHKYGGFLELTHSKLVDILHHDGHKLYYCGIRLKQTLILFYFVQGRVQAPEKLHSYTSLDNTGRSKEVRKLQRDPANLQRGP